MIAFKTIPRDRIPETVRAIRSYAVEGSRSRAIVDFTGEAAQGAAERLGRRPTSEEIFARAYAELAARVLYAQDPYGEERVQHPAYTLERRAGDCDDATTLVLAVARALGFRGRAVVLSAPEPDGGRRALHVFPELETSPGVWTPADLSEALPLGERPYYPTATERNEYPVDALAGPGVGFLDSILGAVTSVLSSGSQEDAARQVRRGQEAEAGALRYSSEQQRKAAAVQANALVTVSQIGAVVDAAKLRSQEAGVAAALAFARDSLPVIAVVLALRAAAPVLQHILKRRAPSRRSPAKAA